MKVAFQGVRGAYSEEAIRQFFGDGVDVLPCQSFAQIFDALEDGDADRGMLPVENAIAGSVSRSFELLADRDMRVQAEVVLRVRHMLIAAPGTEVADLKRARSHPQALSQCRQYLQRHGLELVPGFDTAGSAQALAKTPEEGTAAIAGELAAEMYGLEILDQDIADYPFNYTRFFVLGPEDPPRSRNSKTSLVFAVRHNPGALHGCLGEFASRKINLTKIESRPRRNQPWQYLFYLDFEGHWQDAPCEAALLGLLRQAAFVKMLGSYPAATTPFIAES
jgi:prephenate dehydratase